MLKFSRIKRLGRSPKVVRTAEELEARLKKMRAWTQGPINNFLSLVVQYSIALFILIYMRLFNRTRVHNRHVLKMIKPPFLYISNHLTMFDDFFIDPIIFGGYAIRDKHYLPWHAPEEKNFFLGPVISWFLKKAQCVPLTRGHGVFQPGMTRLKELLRGRAIVHIYPEGTRSRSGDIGRGQVGVGRLAYRTRAKVLPCYHEGTQKLLPIGSHRLRIGKRVEIILGEPLDMTDLYDQQGSREVYQAIADRMIDRIRELRSELHEKGFGVTPLPEVGNAGAS